MATAVKPQPKEYTAESSIGQRLLEVQRLTLEAETIKEALNKEKAYLHAHAIRQNYPSLRMGAILVSRRVSRNWQYTAAVETLEARLKALKAKQQANGSATCTESESLIVNISGKIALRQNATPAALNALLDKTPSQKVEVTA